MSDYILGYPTILGSTKGAIEFLEENIDLIDNDQWEDFFWNMLDNPNNWIVGMFTSYTIIGMLEKSDIKFDEHMRQKVLYEALNNTITALKDSDVKEINLYDLYYLDNGSFLPREDMGNWVGYNVKEFLAFIKDNPDLRIQIIKDTGNMHDTYIKVF